MERCAVTVWSMLLLALVVAEVAQSVLQNTTGGPGSIIGGQRTTIGGPRTTIDPWSTSRGPIDFWGKLKIDCGVSVFGPWGATNSKGYRTRTRTIVRHPQNGGARCPPLTETDFDPWFQSSVSYKARRVQSKLVSGRTDVGINGVRKREAGTIKPRDFLFILDMSGSISSTEYTLQKDNIAKLIGEICGTIGPGRTNNRAAVITYSTDPVVNFDFNDYLNLADLQAAIRSLPKVSRSTCTGKALDLGKIMFHSSKGARSDLISEKEVVLLTDGRSNCGPNPIDSAFGLRNIKTPPLLLFVFAIGNFNAASKLEMESMASAPTSYHLFHFSTFFEFRDVVNFISSNPYPCAPIEIGR